MTNLNSDTKFMITYMPHNRRSPSVITAALVAVRR